MKDSQGPVEVSLHRFSISSNSCDVIIMAWLRLTPSPHQLDDSALHPYLHEYDETHHQMNIFYFVHNSEQHALLDQPKRCPMQPDHPIRSYPEPRVVRYLLPKAVLVRVIFHPSGRPGELAVRSYSFYGLSKCRRFGPIGSTLFETLGESRAGVPPVIC